MLNRLATRFLRARAALTMIALGALGSMMIPVGANPVLYAGASSQTGVADSSSLWVIFLDDLHLDFTATGRLKALFTTVASELIQEGDLFSIVSTGPSWIAVDATRDRKSLDEARAAISGAALKPSEIVGTPVSGRSEVRYRAHLSMSTAYSILKRLQQIPARHKTFIYVSNGFNIDLWVPQNGPLTGADPFTATGNEFSLENLREEAAELARQAGRAKVTIYAIDPRALSGSPSVDPKLSSAAWQQYWTTTRDSLRVIAEATGGFSLRDETGFQDGLVRIRDENRR